jgi:hypothetical protein
MKDLSQLAKDFKVKADEYKRLQANLPRIAGMVAVKVMRENFAKQGFIEEGSEPAEKWKDRDEKTNYGYDNYKTYSGSVYKSTNPILEQTGNLRDSIAYKVEGENKVFIGVNLTLFPQAQAINEGLGNQPKRQFLGWSKILAETIHATIVRRRKAIFRTWLIRETETGKGMNLTGLDL